MEPITATSPSMTSGLLPQTQLSSQQPTTSQSYLSLNPYRSAQIVCSTDAIAILANVIEFNDYKTLLYYFWAHIFVLVCNLKTKDGKDIFEATLPEFVHGGEMKGKLETEFDIAITFSRSTLSRL